MWRSTVADRIVGAGRYLLIGLTALAGGFMISNAVEFWLDPGPALPGAAPRPSSETPEKPERTGRDQRIQASVIFQRNLFGTEEDDVVVADDEPGRAPTRIGFKLRGTAIVEGRGFAVFEAEDGSGQDAFAVGEKVFDTAKLVSVAAASAVVAVKGRRYTIDIEDEDAEEPASAAQPQAKGGSSGAGESGVRKLDDNTYLIDRREVDHSIENLSYVITQARAVPVLRGGESVGFKIFNIRSGSLFEKLGLRNGDVVQQINGTAINEPSKAIGLLDEIQSVDQLTLNFLRGSSPQTFTYKIR